MATAVCTETHQHLKDEHSHVHTNCHVYDLEKLESMEAKAQVGLHQAGTLFGGLTRQQHAQPSRWPRRCIDGTSMCLTSLRA
jgi:hypothetical protein